MYSVTNVVYKTVHSVSVFYMRIYIAFRFQHSDAQVKPSYLSHCYTIQVIPGNAFTD